MKDSQFKVFCLYKRINNAFHKGNYDGVHSIDVPLNKAWYDENPQYIKDQCFRIYNEIENSFYTYNDLKAMMAYLCIWETGIELKGINRYSIEDFLSQFNANKVKYDEKIIYKINEKLKYDGIYKYYEIGDDGEPIVYKLLLDGTVSMGFYMHYADIILTRNFEKDLFFNISKRYFKFCHIMKFLSQLTFNRKGA